MIRRASAPGRLVREEPEVSEAIGICEGCRLEIESDDRGVVRAVYLDDVLTAGDSRQPVEGAGIVFFHKACFLTSSLRYRLKTA
jgi:hypothetical protein